MKLKTLQFILLLIFTTSVSAVTLICKGEEKVSDRIGDCENGCSSSTAFAVEFNSKQNKLTDVTKFLYCKGGTVSNIEIDSSGLGFDCLTSLPPKGKSENYIDRVTGDYLLMVLDKKGELFLTDTGKCKVSRKLF